MNSVTTFHQIVPYLSTVLGFPFTFMDFVRGKASHPPPHLLPITPFTGDMVLVHLVTGCLYIFIPLSTGLSFTLFYYIYVCLLVFYFILSLMLLHVAPFLSVM